MTSKEQELKITVVSYIKDILYLLLNTYEITENLHLYIMFQIKQFLFLPCPVHQIVFIQNSMQCAELTSINLMKHIP